MKTREEIMSAIEFERRYAMRDAAGKEVTITVTVGKKRGAQVGLYFKNNSKEKFKSDRIIFGILKNRIVFEPDASGFKITTNSAKTKKLDYGFIKATVKDADKYKPFIGDYNLLWDEFYEFWYIERKGGDSLDITAEVQ